MNSRRKGRAGAAWTSSKFCQKLIRASSFAMGFSRDSQGKGKSVQSHISRKRRIGFCICSALPLLALQSTHGAAADGALETWAYRGPREVPAKKNDQRISDNHVVKNQSNTANWALIQNLPRFNDGHEKKKQSRTATTARICYKQDWQCEVMRRSMKVAIGWGPFGAYTGSLLRCIWSENVTIGGCSQADVLIQISMFYSLLKSLNLIQ